MASEKFDVFPCQSAAELISATLAAKRRAFAAYGLSEGEALCLCRIFENADGVLVKDLLLSDRWSKSAISRHLATLREKGFLAPPASGRYKQTLILTAAGASAARAIFAEIETLRRTVLHGISDDDFDTFLGTLYKMCENMN